MLGTYITFPELLIWFPLVAGLIMLFLQREKQASKRLALISSLFTVTVSVISLCYHRQ